MPFPLGLFYRRGAQDCGRDSGKTKNAKLMICMLSLFTLLCHFYLWLSLVYYRKAGAAADVHQHASDMRKMPVCLAAGRKASRLWRARRTLHDLRQYMV